MSKIQITPSWKDVKPEGFYVYIHRRATDASVFYIGKGSFRRGWDKFPRSDWGISIAKKNGVLVEVYKSGMSEDCANTLERILIAKHRYIEDRICNMSGGGEGSSGCASVNRKKVYCSNGMDFASTVEASLWVSRELGIYTCFSAIAACASGRIYSSYGFTWSYEGQPSDYIEPSSRRRAHFSKPIFCSNGMIFESLTKSVQWLQSNGKPNANIGKVSVAARNSHRTAYGYSWSYI